MKEQAEIIFFEARELPDEVVDEYLSRACNGDEALRQEVEQLLVDARVAEEYFSESFGGRDFTKPLQKLRMENAGDQIGPYELIRELGEGGFGVVWEARQSEPISRTVALKVIKAGLDTDEVLQRFEAERQALARMDHPHIAKVLDAGATPQGRPFFSMELVDGEPITAFCEKHSLNTKARLTLFTQACSAISHAHQKGVIHRDIKPSNVLVATDDRGEPMVKVIDFGVAKAIEGKLTDATLYTRQEQLLGTPAYMSPEQAGLDNLDIDTRSDIYTLGVLLYELITGETPFDPSTLMQRGYEEIRRIIREEEPPRPSVRLSSRLSTATAKGGKASTLVLDTARMQKSIVGELDWIVMKAMDKHRERRYETAAAFTDDIECFLSDKPITARPPSRGYLLMKFAHRHRTGIHIASAFLVLLVGAVLLSAWLAIRARDAERLSEKRRVTALEDRDAKDRALVDAEAVTRLLTDVLQRPQPNIAGRSVTVVEALDAATEELAEQFEKQPLRKALLWEVLADTYQSLGSLQQGVALREKIFEVYREIHGVESLITRMALRRLVESAEVAGKSKAALKYALLEIETLQKLAAQPAELEHSMRSVVKGWFANGQREKAIEGQRELIKHCRENYGVDSPQTTKAVWELRQYEASAGNAAAGVKNLSDISAAEKKFAALLELNGAGHTETMEAQNLLATALINASHASEALIHLQQLYPHFRQRYGASDDRTLRLQSSMAYLYTKTDQRDEAVKIRRSIVDALRQRDGAAAATTIYAENSLKRELFYAEIGDQYHTFLKDLVAKRTKTLGLDHVETAGLYSDLALVAVFRRDFQETIRCSEIAVPVLRKELGDKNRSTAHAIANLARGYANVARTREAIELYVECSPNMLDDTFVNFECAELQVWLGDMEGYRKTRKNIIRYWDKSGANKRAAPFQLDRAQWLCCLTALDDDKQMVDLLRIQSHAKNIRAGLETNARDRHSELFQQMIQGIILYRLGKYEAALTVLEECNRTKEATQVEASELTSWSQTHWTYFFTAMANHRLGNKEAARLNLDSGIIIYQHKPAINDPLAKERSVADDRSFTGAIYREARALIVGE